MTKHPNKNSPAVQICVQVRNDDVLRCLKNTQNHPFLDECWATPRKFFIEAKSAKEALEIARKKFLISKGFCVTEANAD